MVLPWEPVPWQALVQGQGRTTHQMDLHDTKDVGGSFSLRGAGSAKTRCSRQQLLH